MDAVLFVICYLICLCCYLVGYYFAKKDSESECIDFYLLGARHGETKVSTWHRFLRGEISFEECSEAMDEAFNLWKEGYTYANIKKLI